MNKQTNTHSKKYWLNPDDHPSTGSVVAYHGDSPWSKNDKAETSTFLEIADCHSKVRLHRADIDSMNDFIVKMEKLRGAIDEFITALRRLP